MLSPAAKQRAAFARTETPKVEVNGTAEVDLLVAKFSMDLARIKHLKSQQKRTQVKQGLLPSYADWLDTKLMQLEPLPTHEALMFAWLLIWHLDAGHYSRVLELLSFALAVNIQAPREFERSLVELVTEEISLDLLQREQCAAQEPILRQLAQRVEGQDMADPIFAKLYKALGMAYFKAEPVIAITYFQQAQALYSKSGVKRYLNQLTRTRQPQRTQQRLQAYRLSARAAAQIIGVSAPTLIRRAKRYPELLPHLALKMGLRTVYRFNPIDIKHYLQQHIIAK